MPKYGAYGFIVALALNAASGESVPKTMENIIHLRNWKNIENKPVTGCELVDFLYFTSVAEKQSGMEY